MLSVSGSEALSFVMGWFGRSNKVSTPVGFAEQDNTGQWLAYFKQIQGFLSTNKLKKYEPELAYPLAQGMAEVFIPVDLIAERSAQAIYEVVDENDEVVELSGNLKRVWDKPNPMEGMKDLIYKMTFNSLVVGEHLVYSKMPDSYVTLSADRISNIWVLDPSQTTRKLKKSISNPFLIKSLDEVVEYYKTFFLKDFKIDPKFVYVRNSGGYDASLNPVSPLNKVERNLNNLMAVYQARFNVYEKNGAGGILSRDSKNMNALESAVDPVTRDNILKDLQERNGITGNKNFTQISSVPLKFIKTLGTISELQPFVESETDMIVVGGVFGVNKYLLPISENTTFANQKDAEKGLWQNVVKGICEDRAEDITNILKLSDKGWRVRSRFDNIEVLQEDKKTAYEADGQLLNNLALLKEAGQNVATAYKNLTEKYNG